MKHERLRLPELSERERERLSLYRQSLCRLSARAIQHLELVIESFNFEADDAAHLHFEDALEQFRAVARVVKDFDREREMIAARLAPIVKDAGAPE